MTTVEASGDLDEFGEIACLFRPLTDGAPEARGLADDAAVLGARPGFDLVVTQDALVEGVHFLPDDPPELVARKLLRVNLSDLAAKGATPFGWLLTVAWPSTMRIAAREAFAAGLREDQSRYGVKLLGGDTVRTPGPWTLAATLMGYVPAGRAPSRGGASPGDALLVSGSIGDASLGLRAARASTPFGVDADALIARYRLPLPRLELTQVVLDHARAACDVSDGLLADAGRLASASGCGVDIALDQMPRSPAVDRYLKRTDDRANGLAWLAAGGDDYELALAVAEGDVAAAQAAARVAGTPLTRVGRFREGRGVRAMFEGAETSVASLGYEHR